MAGSGCGGWRYAIRPAGVLVGPKRVGVKEDEENVSPRLKVISRGRRGRYEWKAD